MGSLIPRNPFDRMSVVCQRISKLFDDFFSDDDLFNDISILGSPISAEVKVTDQDVIVKSHLPNIDAKNLDIHVDENSVTIKGSFLEETKKESRTYLLRERRNGYFRQTLPLGESIIPEKAKARFKDGILEITAPKNKHGKNKSLKINIEE